MLRKRRRQSAAFAVLAFTALSGAAAFAISPPAHAEVSDGTLIVVVHRDEDDDGSYDEGGDPPQAGIEIVVTDPAGSSIRGITDDDGRFVLTGTDQLTGGRYQVVAAIPPNLSELVPVDDSLTFASFETAVDLRAGSETVRMGVAPKPVIMAVSPAPQPSAGPAARRQPSAPLRRRRHGVAGPRPLRPAGGGGAAGGPDQRAAAQRRR